MKHLFTFILALLIIGSSFAQKEIPKDYFDNPLQIPLILAGSFGELRSNHFHSGMDIKTKQVEGIPIYAPADGYVSRIKVAHFGFGKALYLKHPNGYSTVYAHLQRYDGNIQTLVKSAQYKKERYEVELFPEPADIPVKKGDLIGYTGDSGSSGGPHLHFEIRDSASRPMNPMLFGIEVPDTKKPIINSVYAYPMGSGAQVNGDTKPYKVRLKKQKDGSYKAENIEAFGKIGFGISSHDQQNGASNKNGVYQIKTAHNGQEKFNILFEKFSFSETRYLNRFIDYGYFKKNKSRIQKLFRESNNPLSIIKNEEDNGFISVSEGFESNFTIEVCDYLDNKVLITIPIKGVSAAELVATEDYSKQEYILANVHTSLSQGKFDMYFPPQSLYEDVYLDISARGDTLSFHKDEVPIHKNVTISADISAYKTIDKSKLYLGRLNYKGIPYYSNTKLEGNTLKTRVRTFGDYVIAADTTKPKIKAINFSEGKWISSNKSLKIKIEDSESGISSYRATINGKYILTEYEYKKDVLTYDFADNIISDAENNLKLIVTDNVGNSTTFEATFFRKQL
jgi:murein DD-endopeptidase MepM/ murein hydrolase activator NlpD